MSQSSSLVRSMVLGQLAAEAREKRPEENNSGPKQNGRTSSLVQSMTFGQMAAEHKQSAQPQETPQSCTGLTARRKQNLPRRQGSPPEGWPLAAQKRSR